MRVIIFLLLVCSSVYIWKSINKYDVPEEVISTKTVKVLIHDTITHRVISKYKVVDSIFVEVPVLVDSALVVKRYFAKYYYKDIIKDSNLVININDTISQNKLIFRKLTYKLLKPTVINYNTNTTLLQRKKYWFASAFMYTNKDFNALGINANYIHDKNIFGAGYDFLNKGIYFQFGYCVLSK